MAHSAQTHGGQRRSADRKANNRTERARHNAAEADKQGISIATLLSQQASESVVAHDQWVQQVRARPVRQHEEENWRWRSSLYR